MKLCAADKDKYAEWVKMFSMQLHKSFTTGLNGDVIVKPLQWLKYLSWAQMETTASVFHHQSLPDCMQNTLS